MLIYESSTSKFSQLVINNQLSDIMRSNFRSYYGKDVGYSEFNSWQNSTQYVNNLIQHAELKNSHILLEYELPYNQSRLDCMLFGKDIHSNPRLVLIELKQWSSVKPSNNQGNVVETYTGGAVREVPHPSEQVKGYHDYLNDFVEFLHNEAVLYSCVYCHNFSRQSDSFLYDDKFQSLLDSHPIFSKGDVSSLSSILKQNISHGSGLEVFNRFMQSNIRPSKKLLKSVSKMIEGEEVFSLLNEQIVAKNTIISELRKNYKLNNKSVIIIQGGPGTGKSVIALHILSYLANKNINILWSCKSKSFREGIRSLIKPRTRKLFNNLYKVINPNIIDPNHFDAILVDEAHRIEKKGDTMYTPSSIRSEMSMIDRIIRSSKTSIFFIDDNQLIRGTEIGSSALIEESAVKFNANVSIVKLSSQFRCNGSKSYLNWLEDILGYTDNKIILSKSDKFDFRIFDSPHKLYSFLEDKEIQQSNSARLTAGFCWPWSSKLDVNGNLIKDVKINDFSMPWETHLKINNSPKGYVKWYEWAYKTEGIKQIGCIYTAQGFEFDYIGVIFGDDFKYDPIAGKLVGAYENNKDPQLSNDSDFDSYIRNIYRVLLTRGLKGCYVYFVNKDTEKYFKQYMEP